MMRSAEDYYSEDDEDNSTVFSYKLEEMSGYDDMGVRVRRND